MADEVTTTTSTPTTAPADNAGVSVSTTQVTTPVVTAPVTTAPASIADASKTYLASLTADQKATPLSDPVTETADDEAPVTLDFEAPTFDEATGQWRNKDGTFAPAPADADATTVTATDPNAPPATEESAAEPAPIVVPLKARDGSVKEIEVTDPEVADMLRANANDGMRRDEFNRRIDGVQSREAELREFETILQTNPEHVFSRLPQASQERLAESIIATHWDAIIDRIARMDQDPTYRVTVAAEARVRQTELAQQTQQAIAEQRYTGQLETACRALIPESVDQATAERFMFDASNDLSKILPTRRVQPSELAEVLAPRIALYRFNESAKADNTDSASSTTAPVAPPVIRAVMRAPAVTTASAVPSTQTTGVAVPRTVMTDGQRIAHAQTGRAIAAAVAPAGAGAAPVRVQVPVHATVEEASKYVRTQLGNHW